MGTVRGRQELEPEATRRGDTCNILYKNDADLIRSAHLHHGEKQHLCDQIRWLAPIRSEISNAEKLVHEHRPLTNLQSIDSEFGPGRTNVNGCLHVSVCQIRYKCTEAEVGKRSQPFTSRAMNGCEWRISNDARHLRGEATWHAIWSSLRRGVRTAEARG